MSRATIARLVPLLERALEAVGETDSPLRVRLLARLAGGPLRDASFPPERKARLSEEALAMARRLDRRRRHPGLRDAWLHPRTPLARTTSAGSWGWRPSSSRWRARAGDEERVFDGHEERFDALIELGHVEAARVELVAMDRVARELRQPSQAWLVGAHEAILALLAGPLDAAERLVEAARDLGERTQGWNATVTYRLQLYALRREQNRLGEIADLIRRSVAEFPTYPIIRCVQTHVLAELGAHDEARAALEALARDRCAALPFDEEWLGEHVPARRCCRTPG